MPTTKPPNDNRRDDDLECQQALEALFLAIIDEAVAAGWPRRLGSLGDLADNLWDRSRSTAISILRRCALLLFGASDAGDVLAVVAERFRG
ncbi:hypothetical protein [Rhizobium sp. Root1220]|uniref:hypothetical protein n=1 Tax=Rhizobium sp. Root1220 TaxID=1736432 RepID=UPI0007013E81|nr:hypothetical protein [Rhizobium sp. Root1220]KQV81882.1 hypothetical protein ASC90_24865 [Rhizobium sp. Root1220]